MPYPNRSTKLIIVIILLIEKDRIKGSTGAIVPIIGLPPSPFLIGKRNARRDQWKKNTAKVQSLYDLRGGGGTGEEEEEFKMEDMKCDGGNDVVAPITVRSSNTKRKRKGTKGTKQISTTKPIPPLKRVKVKKERIVRRKRSSLTKVGGNSSMAWSHQSRHSSSSLSDQIALVQDSDTIVFHQEHHRKVYSAVKQIRKVCENHC